MHTQYGLWAYSLLFYAIMTIKYYHHTRLTVKQVQCELLMLTTLLMLLISILTKIISDVVKYRKSRIVNDIAASNTG